MGLHIGRHIAALSVAAAAMVATAATGFAETPLERGTYLMNSIVACGNCHTPKGPNGNSALDQADQQQVREIDL